MTSSTGLKTKLARPLDFLVIADHSENPGLAPTLAAADPEVLKSDWGRMQYELVKQGTMETRAKAFDNWIAKMNARTDPFADQPGLARTMWSRLTAAAEQYNEPGRFTALIGFEWTSMVFGNNLHRNVIFRDGKDKADQVVPFSQYDSLDPEDLWKWTAAPTLKTSCTRPPSHPVHSPRQEP